MEDNRITDFPMLGYRIIQGVGLGYRLEWFDILGNEWVFVMDSINHFDCVEAMHKDIKHAHEDRWGTD